VGAAVDMKHFAGYPACVGEVQDPGGLRLEQHLPLDTGTFGGGTHARETEAKQLDGGIAYTFVLVSAQRLHSIEIALLRRKEHSSGRSATQLNVKKLHPLFFPAI